MKEKRKFPRIHHAGYCILSREDSTDIETWQSNVLNISAHGASIQCPDNWPGMESDNVRMTLILEGVDIALKLSGIIIHQQPGILGIKFLTVNLDNLAHLRRIIELDMTQKISLDALYQVQ
jgi:hypothetical protein